MAALLQPFPTTLSPRPPTPNRSPQRTNQPSWVLQLVDGRFEVADRDRPILSSLEQRGPAARAWLCVGVVVDGSGEGALASGGHELAECQSFSGVDSSEYGAATTAAAPRRNVP